MSVRVRIAPSPTGNLHIGTARTAVFNWLFARHHGGQFILRVEDTDLERSRPEFTQNITEGLQWLGLQWDEGPFFQSDRMDLYKKNVQTLLDKGLAYRCYATEDELNEMRSLQEAQKQAPRYDNRHRDLPPEQEAAFQAEGREPVIRFRIDDNRTIAWTDLVRGTVSWQGSDLGGDMVIARRAPADQIGQPLYNFVVVVDDVDMGITHVIRGEDHVANTAKQLLLYEALGAAVPQFAHTPLILSPTGKKLSKRDGVTSISDFQKMGYVPAALANYMSLLGWTPPDSTQEQFTLEDAAKEFDFERVNKAGAKFDWDKLNWLNSQYLHEMPAGELVELLIPYWQGAGYGFDADGDRPWLEQMATLVGPSLERLDQGVDMCRYLFDPELEYSEDAIAHLQQDGVGDVLKAVAEALPSATLTTVDEAQSLIKDVTKSTGAKKGLIMKSLRAGLTCSLKGPDLVESWLLLHQKGLDTVRLEKAIALAL
ncbi:MAG: glutamate--tRNA ligase [Leptolyngbyaceae bacterium]|nr:glutamate--tRNA ligase [Leptolyngbyaceae bacterium]